MGLLNAIKRQRRLNRLNRKVSKSAQDTLPVAIVYQMGKVASSSIYHALKHRPDCYGFHTHLLTVNDVADNFWNRNRHDRLSIEIRRQLLLAKRPLKIITLVRDPFARNISAYFETSPKIPKRANPSVTAASLIDDFLENFNHNECEDWFTKEFRDALGIDIFSHPFDPETGWSKIESDNLEILTLKTTLNDELKRDLVENFIGIENLQLARVNETGDKTINALYKEFKSSIHFPEAIFQQVMESDFTQHFFTKSEHESIRQKWS